MQSNGSANGSRLANPVITQMPQQNPSTAISLPPEAMALQQQMMAQMMTQQAQMMAAMPLMSFATNFLGQVNQSMSQMNELREALAQQQGQFLTDHVKVSITIEED